MELDPITINNPKGEAWRQCKMGAREMMVRELVMNAIEACRHYSEGERQIRLYATPVNGTNKLTIWNRGGMGLGALMHFSNINAAIDKRNAIDANFGRGAKIASIMSNMRGIRFRSCFNGVLREVTLAADPDQEIVGRVVYEDAVPGTEGCVRELAPSELDGRFDFHRMDVDWTEVVLCGNEEDQDTTTVPYLDGGLPPSSWLWNAIGMRFFDIPAGIEMKVHSLITRQKSKDRWNNFSPLRSKLEDAYNYESVPFEGGVVHFIQTAPLKGEDKEDDEGYQPRLSTYFATKPFGGIVWRNEIHYLHSGTARGKTTLTSGIWPVLATRWGLVRSAPKVSILVELNDDMAANDINRTRLLTASGAEIVPEDFNEIVQNAVPEWVKALEKALEPEEDKAIKDIRAHLNEIMRDMRNMHDNLALGEGDLGAESSDKGQGDGNGEGTKSSREGRQLDPDPNTRNARQARRFMEAPAVEWVDSEWFQARQMPNMGAHLNAVGDKSTIYFNEDHSIFIDLMSKIRKQLPEYAAAGAAMGVARKYAKRLMYQHVGTNIVGYFALLKFDIKMAEVLQGLGAIVMTGTMTTAYLSQYFKQTVKAANAELKVIAMGGGDASEDD